MTEWEYAIHVKEETVEPSKFEETFNISFQELADWWNKNVLEL